ncbi:type II toxin-antitoxin system HipA family toxin [Geobacter anodireducens]|uniref:Phosphatidylinositol kinase n=1 Tax=Geobacter soli TaxID=1510391 RepID=A0A0C1U198_9BACT|nr:type II toxin-antitoxin system HipA family toxin [Geobacter soli]KIE41545.1 phosphatidylinositol kinase [Geobacter soli]HMN11868.1 type II toxin-antitoxin system HipA family toxin [Bellilinea sp.]
MSSLAVWAAESRAGLLDRSADRRQYVFAYDPAAESPATQVSLTMPVRLESWVSRDLHPIFQMNLPEGALLEAIRRAISKLAGEDDLTILRVTGGNQIGRNRFSLPGASLPGIAETRESLDALLSYPDTEELFHELVSKYALRSGISGVQPKIMLEASERGTATVGRYIVKSWGTEYPHLGANEFFCMTAAQRAGLTVPEFHLSANGGLFVMKRFDLSADGSPRSFEDMCVLQALGTAQKYGSSYERVARSIRDFVSGEFLQAAREQFFASLVLSCMVRNGDAHLKNFGILYDRPGAAVHLAPVYDVVTTVAYLSRDVPALSLAGTKKWWPRKVLEKFAVAYLSLPVGKIEHIIDQAAGAVTDTRGELSAYMKDHPAFRPVGERMLTAWDEGVASLRAQ